MNNVLCTRLKVKPVENGLVVSLVMERRELRRIQKTPASGPVQRNEISKTLVSKAKRNIPARTAERPVIAADASKGPHGA